jgi:hypothetical protein
MVQKVKAGEITFDGIINFPCDNKTGGDWYCVTHKKEFKNQLEKDIHLGANCRMAWNCYEHGLEQP